MCIPPAQFVVGEKIETVEAEPVLPEGVSIPLTKKTVRAKVQDSVKEPPLYLSERASRST